MPQRQKTQPVTLPEELIDELPEISDREYQFVIEMAKGKSRSDAYRAISDTSEWQAKSVWVEASRLAARPNVVLWLKAIKKETIKATDYDLNAHIRDLERAAEIAEASGNVGAMVAAINYKGKALGHYTERVEQISSPSNLEAMLETLEARLGPDLTEQIRRKLGLNQVVQLGQKRA